jgi:uncharacterized protein with PQ loop repeat
MDDFWQEMLGFAAGAIVTSAALPRVLDILRDHDVALKESYARNALLVSGNLIWVVYGILQDAIAVAFMCALSALFNGAILASISLARRRQAQRAAT